MPKATPIKVSFNAGELSPLLDGRTDQSKYFNGCSIVERLIPTVQGPLIRSGGFYFSGETRNSQHRSWLRRFVFNVTQSYVLEFGDHYIRFFTNRGQVLEATKNITGITQANPAVVTSNSHGYANGDFVYIAGVVGMTRVNGQVFKVAGVTTNTFQLLDVDGNNVNSTGFAAYVSGGTVARIYQITTPYAVADLTDADGNFKLTFEQSGDVLYIMHGSYQTQKLSRFGALNWTIAAVAFENGPFKDTNSDNVTTVYASAETGTGITLTASSAIFLAGHVGSLFYLEQRAIDGVKQWEVGKSITSGDRRRSGVNNYLALNTATTGSVKPTHTKGAAYDGDTGVQWQYVDSGFGIVQITAIGGGGTTATADVITRLPIGCVGAPNASTYWAHQLISSAEGWPEVPVIFRERLGFLKGLRGALSVSGDYENFAKKIDGTVTADAAIQFTVPDSNPPRWMREGNDLLVGTGGREIAVGEITTSDPLGPGNIKARKQTVFGSRAVEPVEVGDSILFVTRSGKKLREIRYSWETNSYQSVDLTVLSEHIAKAGISQMAYQQEPFSVVWSCTTLGELLGFTYNREQDVLGWHRHPVGGSAIVESVCSIPSPDGKGDDLWIQARLTINGATRRYIGWMVAPFDGDDSDLSDAFYVDFGLTYSGVATDTITGLYHLKGCTVDILADGSTHDQKVVDSNGTITLDREASIVQVGLPCPARLRTMRLDAGSALGTAQGKTKRITRILLRMLKTLGGKFGPNDSNLDPIIYHEGGETMDAPPALLTGDRTLPWPGGYDTEGYVNLVWDTPTPATVITIVTDAQTNES